MRVIFAGHTGINKGKVLSNLALVVREKQGLPADSSEPLVIDFEKELVNHLGGSFSAFLRTGDFSYQLSSWTTTMKKINKELTEQDPKPKSIFLSLHCTFYVAGRLFSLLDLKGIRDFNPTHIVTLIDDIYEVQGRIKHKSGQEFYLRLRELLAWRSMEIAMAEFLTRSLKQLEERPIKHYVLAVKHSKQMLYNLLYKTTAPKFYASIPITATRSKANYRYEIDRVRQELCRRYPVVFDPLTIDEDIPGLFNSAKRKRRDLLVVNRGSRLDRWPIPERGTLTEGRQDVYPLHLSAEELLEAEANIKEQIEPRDLMLIDQVDCVAGYRPNYRGEFSKGMFAEFLHARDVAEPKKDLHFFHPKEDEKGGHPFTRFEVRHKSKRKWLEALDNYAKE